MTNGREGELLFQKRMEQKGYEVKDVSKDSLFWNKDIDFIITSPATGAVKTFEVKWDGRIHKTNNLYLELANAHSAGGLGFFEFCQADYLVYGDSVNKVFYVFSLLELKEKVKKLPKNYAECKGDSIGLLVDLDDVKDLYQIV